MPETSELKSLLLKDIDLQEDVRKMYLRLINRQTITMLVAIALFAISVGIAVAILIQPTHADETLMKYLEEQRSALVIKERDLEKREQLLQRERESMRNFYLKTLREGFDTTLRK